VLAALMVGLAAVMVAVVGALSLSGRSESGRASGSRPIAALPPPLPSSTNAAAPNVPAAAVAGVDSFRLRFKRPPRAGMVFDVGTGEILWRHHPVDRRPVASLTKVMTALLVVDETRPRDQARITKDALDYRGSAVGLLPKGRHVPVESLLHGLLMPSGNDAAIALADHVAGSRAAFVALMNQKAQKLGLRCTHFRSPSGIEDGDRSCAADLAALARYAMARKRIARIARKPHASVKFPKTKWTKRGRLFLSSTNPLLRMGYHGTLGLKTGYTNKAGRCLIAIVRRGSRTLGVVLLGSPDPQRQARSLFAKAFRV
jgi:D-alanyl-D-alanine carboxypeptidase